MHTLKFFASFRGSDNTAADQAIRWDISFSTEYIEENYPYRSCLLHREWKIITKVQHKEYFVLVFYLQIETIYIIAHFPVQWQYTKPAQINSGTDSKTVPTSKIKGQCAGNTPNTSILANSPRRSDTKID